MDSKYKHAVSKRLLIITYHHPVQAPIRIPEIIADNPL